MKDRLDKAIAEFEDETLDMSLGERISGLRQAIMWNAFTSMQKIKKHGLKATISEEETYKQEECMRYFKEIEKMYLSEVKMNKATGKTDDNMNKYFLKKIKEEKGSIGSIVRDIKPLQKAGNE